MQAAATARPPAVAHAVNGCTVVIAGVEPQGSGDNGPVEERRAESWIQLQELLFAVGDQVPEGGELLRLDEVTAEA